MELISFVPESLILVIVATNLMGMFLKQIEFVKDNVIPILLLMFSILCSLAIEGATTEVALQGIVCWGIAVGVHQTLHQIKKI